MLRGFPCQNDDATRSTHTHDNQKITMLYTVTDAQTPFFSFFLNSHYIHRHGASLYYIMYIVSFPFFFFFAYHPRLPFEKVPLRFHINMWRFCTTSPTCGFNFDPIRRVLGFGR